MCNRGMQFTYWDVAVHGPAATVEALFFFFQSRLKGSGSTVMNLGTRGSSAQTRILALENRGSTAQCQRAEPSPGYAVRTDPRHESAATPHYELSCGLRECRCETFTAT